MNSPPIARLAHPADRERDDRHTKAIEAMALSQLLGRMAEVGPLRRASVLLRDHAELLTRQSD